MERGELDEEEKKTKMRKTVSLLKDAQEQDAKKIEKLHEMVEQLLLAQKGNYFNA